MNASGVFVYFARMNFYEKLVMTRMVGGGIKKRARLTGASQREQVKLKKVRGCLMKKKTALWNRFKVRLILGMFYRRELFSAPCLDDI